MNKKLTLVLLMSAFTMAGTYAQMPSTGSMQQMESTAKPTVSQKAKAMLDKITSATHITPDQAKKALPLLEEYYNKLEAAKKSEPAKTGTETSAAKENLLTKLKGVVSADQLEKIKALVTEKMGKL